MDDDERQACKAEGLDPDDPAVIAAIDLVRWELSVLALSRMLGHTSAKVTLDTYADLFDTDHDAVASTLELKCAHSVPKRRPVGTVGA
ncbi:MAG: hypothetical protein QOG95_774 [Mycobacterium sp.]|nr:hypothetical protein [Mycobacterium sp.]